MAAPTRTRLPASVTRHAAPARPALPLTVVLLATFINQFGLTAVSVALPSLQTSLNASYAAIEWVLAGYMLPFALLLVTGGRLGDVAGRKRVFLLGVAGFTVASGLAGIAPDVQLLVAARVLQGVAAALMAPQVLAIFQVVVPAHRRAPALAAYGSVISLATVSGPIVGGILVQADILGWGWRSILLVNLPIGLLTMVGGLLWLTESRSDERLRLDLGQVVLAAVTLLLLIYPLTHGRELGWPWWTWVSLAASVPALYLFVAYQRRVGPAAALVPLHMFRLRAFSAGLLATFIVSTLITGFFFVFVVYVQSGLGQSAADTGWTMAPWALGTALGSMAAIPLSRKLGRLTLFTGAVLMAVGMAILAITVLDSGTSPASTPTGLSLFVFGIGVTMVSAPILDITLKAIPTADAGAASGVFSTFRQTGAAAGVAIIGAVFFGALGAGDYAAAIQATTIVTLGLCGIVFALIILLPRMPTR